jgi:NAD(P)-dependent dehydrogenase (short-subunit alcohol dehydrogenase family)
MTKGMRESGKFEEYKELVPLGRAAEPDEMAGMAVFLMSDHSSCKSDWSCEDGTRGPDKGHVQT